MTAIDSSGHSSSIKEALGQSEPFLAFQEQLSRAAPIDRPVLLVGERGTGKELAASRLHYLSKRWQGPLIALNCAALASPLIESELFGYEKGAFTGADRRRAGRFEAADEGTLFLDEIGNIPVEVQEKILRVVEYGTFERIGSSESMEVDVRIIAATNADLIQLAASGRFKRDLLDRLSFEVLFLPPLRERKEDIILLADHFAARMAFEMGASEIPRFSEKAAEILMTYDWPGNIRELKNVVERAVYRSDSSVIEKIDFNPFRSTGSEPGPAQDPTRDVKDEALSIHDLLQMSFGKAVEELEIHLLRKTLEESKYNQRKAAQKLDLTYHQFRGLYRKYKDKVS